MRGRDKGTLSCVAHSCLMFSSKLSALLCIWQHASKLKLLLSKTFHSLLTKNNRLWKHSNGSTAKCFNITTTLHVYLPSNTSLTIRYWHLLLCDHFRKLWSCSQVIDWTQQRCLDSAVLINKKRKNRFYILVHNEN